MPIPDNAIGFAEPDGISSGQGVHVVLPRGIASPHALLAALSQALRFPSYFDPNWNALREMLRDFHWLDHIAVTIIHQDLPSIEYEALSIYLQVLQDACDCWRDDPAHILRVTFPPACRAEVQELLAAA